MIYIMTRRFNEADFVHINLTYLDCDRGEWPALTHCKSILAEEEPQTDSEGPMATELFLYLPRS